MPPSKKYYANPKKSGSNETRLKKHTHIPAARRNNLEDKLGNQCLKQWSVAGLAVHLFAPLATTSAHIPSLAPYHRLDPLRPAFSRLESQQPFRRFQIIHQSFRLARRIDYIELRLQRRYGRTREEAPRVAGAQVHVLCPRLARISSTCSGVRGHQPRRTAITSMPNFSANDRPAASRNIFAAAYQ